MPNAESGCGFSCEERFYEVHGIRLDPAVKLRVEGVVVDKEGWNG